MLVNRHEIDPSEHDRALRLSCRRCDSWIDSCALDLDGALALFGTFAACVGVPLGDVNWFRYPPVTHGHRN